MKIKIKNSNYDKETGISTIVILTDCGEFKGKAVLHEEDRDIESSFAGCQIAEMRAIVKYFKYRVKVTKIKIEGLINYEKTLKNRKDYNKHSIENRKLRRYIKELENEKNNWEERARSLKNNVYESMKAREKMVRKMMKEKSEK